MNERSKKKREERVKKQKLKEKSFLIKERKERNERERFQYLTRVKKTPFVNTSDTILERNIKMLEKTLAEHEGLMAFREENKDKLEENIEIQKKAFEENVSMLNEVRTDGMD